MVQCGIDKVVRFRDRVNRASGIIRGCGFRQYFEPDIVKGQPLSIIVVVVPVTKPHRFFFLLEGKETGRVFTFVFFSNAVVHMV